MKSFSEDSVVPRPRARRLSPRLWTVLVWSLSGSLVLLGAWVVMDLVRVWSGEVSLVHTALVLSAFFTALLVLLAAALGWHAGVRLTRQRLYEPLREARQLLHAHQQLQGDWQWASDAEHRLIRWQAPQGAPASSWVGAAPTSPCVWERFQAGAQVDALRGQMLARQALSGLALRDVQGGWRLQGLPLHDAQGNFSGYLGTARPDAPVLAVPDAALAAEYESFSYSVSHDLRAPLRVVDGFARILKEDYGRLLDRIGNDHLDRVMGASARMNGMIEALLSMSQLSTRPLAHQPVNLSQLGGFVIEELRRAQPARSVEVQIEPDLCVQGDPTLLRMLLENLLGNAWKYSAKVELAGISLAKELQNGRRVFVVSDNGAGFDMRYAERLFGVFQRLHSASEFPGTGVGLALTRRIVARHGGEIWAESAPGEGARFYFTLA